MSNTDTTPYQVLARKYRPQTFADLIGQDVLVQTISNAIATNRIAHAFLLTGIRGIGKTTTARIIARTLNCIGPDGKSEATAEPCGVCEHCTAISEDRHPDVIEMDAASRTGVNDVREIIENANYLPSTARYKIYIIDEVHMLSNSAFNALLKTLEEPPAHVKFIFATTELRKIPVTILSRCQRFDLQRIAIDMLAEHLQNIAKKENYELAPEAANLLANAAEGSVRDGLSLLDQAIAHASSQESKIVEETIVSNMLGLADKTKLFDLFDQLIAGNIADCLETANGIYQQGGDPVTLLQDLLAITHLATQAKIAPKSLESPTISELERTRANALLEKADIALLARYWQMLLKGLNEAKQAPNTLMAAEMILIRIAYSADLPSPANIIRSIQKQPTAAAPAKEPIQTPAKIEKTEPVVTAPIEKEEIQPEPQQIAPQPTEETTEITVPKDFAELTALFEKNKEVLLYNHLVHDTHLVDFQPGHITLRLSSAVSPDFVKRVIACLKEWTNQTWQITTTKEGGDASIHEQQQQAQQEECEAAKEHPEIQAVLQTFPGAEVKEVVQSDPKIETTEAAAETPKEDESATAVISHIDDILKQGIGEKV